MNTRYRILFSIELLHEYYENLQCRDFALVPSPETELLLRKHQLLYKQTGHILFILCKVQKDEPDHNKPVIPLAIGARFVFYLDLQNPSMLNYTNLDLDRLNAERFYFTNLHENKTNNTLYLSSKLPAYDSAKPYMTGDLVRKNNRAHESLTTMPDEDGNPHDVNEASFWRARGNFQFVTKGDMIRFVRPVELFTVTSQNTFFIIKLFKLNSSSLLYDEEIKLAHSEYSTDNPTKTVQVNFTGITPGKYRLLINSQEYNIFLDGNAVYRNYFGVIELHHVFADGADFSFLDNEQRVKDLSIPGIGNWMRFVLRFANRLAFWKYVATTEQVTAIDDDSSQFQFNAIALPPPPVPASAKSIFLSNKPIAMTQKPSVFDLVLVRPPSGNPPRAPNPDPMATGMLTREDGQFYCTIFLNH